MHNNIIITFHLIYKSVYTITTIAILKLTYSNKQNLLLGKKKHRKRLKRSMGDDFFEIFLIFELGKFKF